MKRVKTAPLSFEQIKRQAANELSSRVIAEAQKAFQDRLERSRTFRIYCWIRRKINLPYEPPVRPFNPLEVLRQMQTTLMAYGYKVCRVCPSVYPLRTFKAGDHIKVVSAVIGPEEFICVDKTHICEECFREKL